MSIIYCIHWYNLVDITTLCVLKFGSLAINDSISSTFRYHINVLAFNDVLFHCHAVVQWPFDIMLHYNCITRTIQRRLLFIKCLGLITGMESSTKSWVKFGAISTVELRCMFLKCFDNTNLFIINMHLILLVQQVMDIYIYSEVKHKTLLLTIDIINYRLTICVAFTRLVITNLHEYFIIRLVELNTIIITNWYIISYYVKHTFKPSIELVRVKITQNYVIIHHI